MLIVAGNSNPLKEVKMRPNPIITAVIAIVVGDAIALAIIDAVSPEQLPQMAFATSFGMVVSVVGTVLFLRAKR